MSITLDPATLPVLDIIKLAQSGRIIRSERETAHDGIPCFIVKEDWERLKTLPHSATPLSNADLLCALEKVSALFLQEAAKTCQHLKTQSPEPILPSTFEIESDLFPDQKKIFLLIVRDSEHPVACAIIGTSSALLNSLRSPALSQP